MPTKIIVTHQARMKKKYGSGWTKIRAVIGRLIKADKARGVTTLFVALDDPDFGDQQAKKTQASFKAAVDHAYHLHKKPDYITVLGGPDIVPHQDLVNPLTGTDDEDDDKEVPSDLPYACDAPGSKQPEDFIGPTRVVGRIPDLPKIKNASGLVALIDRAAKWKPKAKSPGKAFFGLSTDAWKGSTRRSVRALFGKKADPFLSPEEGPIWSLSELGPVWHFINCHGAPSDPQFYGEKKNKEPLPVAHRSNLIGKRVSKGTVVAAECCYGAEMYDPSDAEAPPLSVTYLAEGAIGFLGSTTIAYGPENTNSSADLICRFFLESVRKGATLGRAALEARQRFVKSASPLDPVDLKTLAQFLLLGDPALRAVAVKGVPLNAKAAPKLMAAHVARRGQLEAEGATLTRGASAVESGNPKPIASSMKQRLEREITKAGYVPSKKAKTYDVKAAPDTAARALVSAKTAAAPTTRFHVVSASRVARPPAKAAKSTAPAKGKAKRAKAAPPPTAQAVPRRMILVAREVAGKVVEVRRVFAHGRRETRARPHPRRTVRTVRTPGPHE